MAQILAAVPDYADSYPTETLPWAAATPPRLPRPVSRPLALHQAERPARMYLSRHGGPAAAPQPLARALPLLLEELTRDRSETRRDLTLAGAMLLAVLALLGTLATDIAVGFPWNWMQPLLALAGAGWAGVVAQRALARRARAQEIGALLHEGDWTEAFRRAA